MSNINDIIPLNNIKRENIDFKNQTIDLEMLISLKQIIFNLREENLVFSTQRTMKLFDLNYPYSFNYVLSNLIYFAFFSQKNEESNIYINYLQLIQEEEKKYKNIPNIIEFFGKYISGIKSQEAYYLIEKMTERNLINKNIAKNIKSEYFAHYKTRKENKKQRKYNYQFYQTFFANYKKLSKNDWELHKRLIEEGVNPNELAKIIRNDEVEKLQEISSQNGFNFNQTIKPSLYERCSFINQENVTLIDYAAFFSSVKCFKYLLMNEANVKNTGKYAVAGGNEEIIHLCEQNHSSFTGAYKTAIKFHQNDIFKYIYEKKLEVFPNFIEILRIKCILYHNYEILSFLQDEGSRSNGHIINEAARIGNLLLVKCFQKFNQLPKDILVFSIESGNIELVQYILQQKEIDVNAQNERGNTALLIASFNTNIEVFKVLLKQKGIDINAKNNNEKTALMYASINGCIEMVKLLLKQEGIDINARDINGNTALIIASENDRIEIVKLLLEQEGFDINARDNWGDTALMRASVRGHKEIVKLLLEQEGIDINAIDNNGKTEIILAIENGRTEIVQLLLEQGEIDINAIDDDGEILLIWAFRRGNIEIVKLLLEQEGFDINAKDNDGNTALIISSSKGYAEMVKLLLEQEGIDINAKSNWGKTALLIASVDNRTEIVKLLLEKEGIDINAKGNWGETALILAIEKGYIEIVKLLLEQEGIDINAKNNWGNTALMRASVKGHIEIVKLLLEQEGIDINAKNNDGEAALIIAFFGGYTEIFKLLLEQEEIDINAKNKICFNNLIFQNNIWKLLKIFETLLIWASRRGNIEMVKSLLKRKGINIDEKDICFSNSKLILIVQYFKILFGNCFNYFLQHLFMLEVLGIKK